MTGWRLPMLGALLLVAGCTLGRPVGAVGRRVPSGYRSTPLAIVDAAADEVEAEVRGDAAPATASVNLAAYVVQPGDTLWSIARRHGTTVDRLYALNGINDPRELRAGRTLQVPHAEGPASTSMRSPAPETADAPPVARSEDPSEHRAGATRYPFSWPVEGVLTSRFGRRGARPHDGIDIGAPKGTPVRAAAPGEVIFSGTHGGYGKLVLVRHATGLVTVYAHQSDLVVRKGQRVAAGQLLGHVGTTGRASGPHLHFEVRRGVSPQNPLRFLPP